MSGYTVEFKKPYNFEGETYSSIDLGGLEKLTIQDAIEAQRQLFGKDEAAMRLCESSTAFVMLTAAKATQRPIEFFSLMPRLMFKKVYDKVFSYLNVDLNVENHIMQLASPVEYKGKTYNCVDLNGIADLNTLNESDAENRMTKAGFIAIGNNGTNYLYCCAIASMASGIEEEFFTSLPIRELAKLRIAVNDESFFE